MLMGSVLHGHSPVVQPGVSSGSPASLPEMSVLVRAYVAVGQDAEAIGPLSCVPSAEKVSVPCRRHQLKSGGSTLSRKAVSEMEREFPDTDPVAE